MTTPITHDPQVLKGLLSMVLLRLLAEQESYGYELVGRVRAAGLAAVSESSVYPALTRLEREGVLASRLVPSASGPARKYYRVAAAGLTALADAERSWRELAGVIDELFATPTPTRPRTAEDVE